LKYPVALHETALKIVMDSSNLEETYDDESDVEDSEADDELKGCSNK